MVILLFFLDIDNMMSLISYSILFQKHVENKEVFQQNI